MSSISKKMNIQKSQQKGNTSMSKIIHFGSITRCNTEDEKKKLLENSDHSHSKNNLRNSLPSSKVPVLLKSTLRNHRENKNNQKKDNPRRDTFANLNSNDSLLKESTLGTHCPNKSFQDLRKKSLSHSNIPQSVSHSYLMETPPLKIGKDRKFHAREIHSKKELPMKISLSRKFHSDINISSYSTVMSKRRKVRFSDFLENELMMSKRKKVRFSDFLENELKTDLKTNKNVSDREKSGCKYNENSKTPFKKYAGMSTDEDKHIEEKANIFCNNHSHNDSQRKYERDENELKTDLKTNKDVSDREKSGCKYNENSKTYFKKYAGMSTDEDNHIEEKANIFCNNHSHNDSQRKYERDENELKTDLKTNKNVSDREKSGCKYNENSKTSFKKYAGISTDEDKHIEEKANIFCNNHSNNDFQRKYERDENLEKKPISSNSCDFEHANGAESFAVKKNLIHLFEKRNKESKEPYSGTSNVDNRNGVHEVNEYSLKMSSLMSDESEAKTDCTKKLMECTSNFQSGAKTAQSQDNSQKLLFSIKESIGKELNDKLKVLTAKFLQGINKRKKNNPQSPKFRDFKRSYFNNMHTAESHLGIGNIVLKGCETDDKVHLGEKDISFKKSNEDATLNQLSIKLGTIPCSDSHCSKTSSNTLYENNSSIMNRKGSPKISPGNSRIPLLIHPTKGLSSPQISPVLDRSVKQCLNKTDIESPPLKRINLESEVDAMTEISNEKLTQNYYLKIFENIELDSLSEKKENENNKCTEGKINFDGPISEQNGKEKDEETPKTHVLNLSTAEIFSSLNENSCSSSYEKQKQNKTVYSETSPIFTDHDFYENSEFRDTSCQKLGANALDGNEENSKQLKLEKCDNPQKQSKTKVELPLHVNVNQKEKMQHLKWKQMTIKAPASKGTNHISVLYSKKILFILLAVVCFGFVVKLMTDL